MFDETRARRAEQFFERVLIRRVAGLGVTGLVLEAGWLT